MKRHAAIAATMLAGAALYGLAPAAAQDAHGVIAVGETATGDGVAYGFAWNFPAKEAAQAEAVNACTSSGGTNCVELAQFRNGCGALAIDRHGYARGNPGMTRDQAEARALRTCEAAGGAGCNIVGSTCTAPDTEPQTYSGSESVFPAQGAQTTVTGPADESLTREERVLLQQTLSALGFDIGPADGVFGPRTRAVIHEWQNASGHEATGYLTRKQFASLTAVDPSPGPEPESQQETADDGSENVLVFGLDTGPKCAGMSEGSSCWKELAGKPGCHVWDPSLVPGQTVAWSGTCRDGMAVGQGTLTWSADDWSLEMTGTLYWGQANGHWVERYSSGSVQEGPFVDGKRHGRWVWRYPDGRVQMGPYVKGKQHGRWVWRYPDGSSEEIYFTSGALRNELKSEAGETSTFIHFSNRSDETVYIYWVNYKGQEEFYHGLGPGDPVYKQQTYVTHPWVVRAQDRKILATIIATTSEQEVRILDDKVTIEEKAQAN